MILGTICALGAGVAAPLMCYLFGDMANDFSHLSGPYEILLMILGTICALGAGVAAPLMCYLFGDMANDFSDANVDENQVDLLKQLLECKTKEEAEALAGGNSDRGWSYGQIYLKATALFQTFDDNVDGLVRKLLIIGSTMFVAFGGQKLCLWLLVVKNFFGVIAV